jgi:hypothetical protein
MQPPLELGEENVIEFSINIQSVTIGLQSPQLKIAPPLSSAELLVNVQFVIVGLHPFELTIPPPEL